MIVFMRWLFALLLIANMALFAMMQLHQENPGNESIAGHTPLHAEQIRLLSDTDLPQPTLAATPPPAPAAMVCLEWGIFARQDLAKAQSALRKLQLDEGAVSVHNMPEKASKYWVYIPPLKTKADAQKKQDELKALGIEESLVLQDNNKWRYAISLGVFSTQEAAEKYLAELRGKNVRSAKAGPRTLDEGHASLRIKATGADLEANVVKIKQDFEGTELKAVPCAP